MAARGARGSRPRLAARRRGAVLTLPLPLAPNPKPNPTPTPNPTPHQVLRLWGESVPTCTAAARVQLALWRAAVGVPLGLAWAALQASKQARELTLTPALTLTLTLTPTLTLTLTHPTRP